MNQYTLFLILATISFVICAMMIFQIATYRRGRVLKGITSITVCLILLLFAYTGALLAGRPESAMVFHGLVYVLHSFLSLLVIYAAKSYNPLQFSWINKFFPLFFVVPIINILMVLTPEGQRLIWDDVRFTHVGVGMLAEMSYGRWFWIDFIYQYASMILAYSMVSSKFLASKALYGSRVLWIFVGLVVASSGNIIHMLRLFPALKQDFTPITLVLGGAILIFSSLRGNVVELVPIAREVVFDHMSEGFIVLNSNGLVVDYNRSIQRMLPPNASSLGKRLEAVFPELDGWEEQLMVDASEEVEFDVNGHQIMQVTRENLLNDDGGRVGTLITLRDITETVRLRKDLEMLAITDPLTGLSNRRYFLQQAELAVAQAMRHRLKLSMIMLDIDHFKEVNDTYGHKVGDEILVGLTKAINSSVRIVDTFSRFGGEEFMLLLPFTGKDEAILMAERLLKLVHDLPFHTSAGELNIRVSLGVATFGAHGGDNLDDFINRADNGLYFAKRAGRDRLCFYDDTGDQLERDCRSYSELVHSNLSVNH